MNTAVETPPEGAVRLSIDGPVAHILFDRPAARNAMTWAMYEGLVDACRQVQEDPNIRVATLRGAGGKAFVAGTDIEQFTRFGGGADGIAYEERVAGFVASLQNLTKPTIAVVEGWAVGGGMALASACDFRVAAHGAKFGVPIARTLGNCLSISNLRGLTDMLGPAMVKRMLLLADMISAEELTASGYLLAVVDAEELNTVVKQLTDRLAANAPVTMSVTKQALARLATTANPSDLDLVELCYGSNDFREGVAAFVGKRAPVWSGS
ncbi:MAG: enoyl-CoA hydratase/isomerase family protein [Burkholderiaceae bacterium]